MRFTLRRLFGSFGIVAAIAVAFGFFWAVFHAESGENLPSVDWLPSSATNISYYKSYSYTAYEFDIPELDFVAWSHWELKPIVEPFDIPRYILPLQESRNPDEEWHVVTNGLFYEHRRDDGGGVRIAYDRDEGRGYFQRSPR